MKLWIGRFFKFLGILIVLFLLWHWKSLTYGIRQGYGQAKVIIAAQPIDHFLQKADYPDSLKYKIGLIQEVRQYTIDSLGMDESNSYKRLYDQGKKPLIWLVTASKPFALEAYEWDFPIAGKFSYKGYFSKDDAKREAHRLKTEGYDINVGEVSAWSTLGWLNDPILSSMLEREEGRLVELIVHELMHGTLYVKDGVTFNENLASFIGEEGALRFMHQKYGESSPQMIEYLTQRADEEMVVKSILRGTHRLDSLYASLSKKTDTTGAYAQKDWLISEIMQDLKSLPLSSKRFILALGKMKKLPNNAYFMRFRRYDSRKYLFEDELRNDHANNLRTYIDFLRNKYK